MNEQNPGSTRPCVYWIGLLLNSKLRLWNMRFWIKKSKMYLDFFSYFEYNFKRFWYFRDFQLKTRKKTFFVDYEFCDFKVCDFKLSPYKQCVCMSAYGKVKLDCILSISKKIIKETTRPVCITFTSQNVNQFGFSFGVERVCVVESDWVPERCERK